MWLVWVEIHYKCEIDTGFQRLSTKKENVKYLLKIKKKNLFIVSWNHKISGIEYWVRVKNEFHLFLSTFFLMAVPAANGSSQGLNRGLSCNPCYRSFNPLHEAKTWTCTSSATQVNAVIFLTYCTSARIPLFPFLGSY